jgi:nitrate/TMAO reductase-like tetraheme cytochrome c subunit
MTSDDLREPSRPTAAPADPVPAESVPPRRGRWPFILAILGGIVFLFAFFVGSVEFLHYTESTAFCSMCHVMAPEVTAYENSPHARAECGSCHIGPGALPAVQSKIAAVRYLWKYPTNTYERPIPSPIVSMRPVEVVCEQCHWPEKFYADRVQITNKYAADAENSLTRTLLTVRTGGGREAEGQGRGIHWHIANPVYYIATDEDRQNIPWVSATFEGVTTEYWSTDTDLTPEALEKYEKRKMDCIDCHNRASHEFRRPSEVVDEAMASRVLPADLPFLKARAVSVLEKQYATEEEGRAAVSAVETYYQNEQAQVYAERGADVKAAVVKLQEIFNRTQFPFMNVTWQSHPDNLGHTDFPGCFRCHDGKHLSAENEAIRLECNVCHTIPQVGAPGQPLPALTLSAENEPESHRSTTWLAEHRYQFDATCADCHTIDNPGGSDNSSFCSNSACHATEWQFAGLNAPRIRELSAPPQTPGDGIPAAVPHPITARTDCTLCHATDKVHPWPEDHNGFSADLCTQCHTAPAGEGDAAPAVAAPTIPHQLAGMDQCDQCHSADGMKPVPDNHTSFTLDQCLLCHKPAGSEPGGTAPSATATPGASSGPGGAAGGPPAIPHDLAGRDDCLACHNPEGGMKPAPADHVGRTNDTCQTCHKLVQ